MVGKMTGKWLKISNEEQWGRFQELQRDPATDIRKVEVYFDFKNDNFYVVSADLELSVPLGTDFFLEENSGYII